jgi:hypothetical protein
MIDPSKLQYMTMAARLRGYAEGLLEGYQGEARHGTLAKTLNKAADMLDAVWEQHIEEQEDLKPGGTD